MKNNKNKGFTLIELMVVVAIIGILTAIVAPAYQDYLKETAIATGMQKLESRKKAVALCVIKRGELNGCTAGSHGIPEDHDGIRVSHGIIGIAQRHFEPAEVSFSLLPNLTPNKIDWIVRSGGPDSVLACDYLKNGCLAYGYYW